MFRRVRLLLSPGVEPADLRPSTNSVVEPFSSFGRICGSSEENREREAQRAILGRSDGAKGGVFVRMFGGGEGRKQRRIKPKPACRSGGFSATENVSIDRSGGGGGNRTHVRRTVPIGYYERSLRFEFAGRTPTGRLTARLVRCFSPPPYEPRGSGKLDVLTPKPTLPAPSGGRRRCLGGECQRVRTVGS
jgi:hypothetical protein